MGKFRRLAYPPESYIRLFLKELNPLPIARVHLIESNRRRWLPASSWKRLRDVKIGDVPGFKDGGGK
jgi:hypothetical protein